jgi:hypothetical protein
MDSLSSQLCPVDINAQDHWIDAIHGVGRQLDVTIQTNGITWSLTDPIVTNINGNCDQMELSLSAPLVPNAPS